MERPETPLSPLSAPWEELVLADGARWRLAATMEAPLPVLARLAALLGLRAAPTPRAPSPHLLSLFPPSCGSPLPEGGLLPGIGRRRAGLSPGFDDLLDWFEHLPGGVAVTLAERGGSTVLPGGAADLRRALTAIALRSTVGGGLPLHGALLEHEGRGVVLSGSSGAGKTTLAGRARPPWRALSDDGTLVVGNDARGYVAHPWPAGGTVNAAEGRCDVRRALPLSGVFFLRHGLSDRTGRLGRARAANLLCSSALQGLDPDAVFDRPSGARRYRKLAFENACSLAASVPCFQLVHALGGEALAAVAAVLPAPPGPSPHGRRPSVPRKTV